MNRLKSFVFDESGASAVEYGLLIALIAVVAMGAIASLGSAVKVTFYDRVNASFPK